MKKIIYSLLFLIGNMCFSQTIKECEGFIDWRYNKYIKVFSDSEGKFKIDKIKNDNKNENYLFFRIIETNKNFLKVEIGLLKYLEIVHYNHHHIQNHNHRVAAA